MKIQFANVMFFGSVISATALFAKPAIDASSVTMTHDASTGETIVTYKLSGSEPAIVTMDIETNAAHWTSIGPEALGFTGGDVNRLITETGVAKTIHWRPGRTWPGASLDKSQIRAVVKAWSKDDPPEWMVADLTSQNNVSWFVSTNALPFGGITSPMYKREYLLMRRIPANHVHWWMGAKSGEVGIYNANSENRHQVTLTKDYYMGVYAFTQNQYDFLTDKVNVGTDMKPMVNVMPDTLRGKVEGRKYPNSTDIDEGSIIDEIRDRVGIDVDLPTSAQWEFACRAGTGTGTYIGDLTNKTVSANLDRIAWYKGNCNAVHPVGELEPNDFLLYDMLGNVDEYCLDFLDTNKVTEPQTDPKGPTSAQATESDGRGKRVLRGGDYNHDAQYCRAAHNSWGNATATAGRGFRLCWTLP